VAESHCFRNQPTLQITKAKECIPDANGLCQEINQHPQHSIVTPELRNSEIFLGLGRIHIELDFLGFSHQNVGNTANPSFCCCSEEEA
jgi:hypothetical protein